MIDKGLPNELACQLTYAYTCEKRKFLEHAAGHFVAICQGENCDFNQV